MDQSDKTLNKGDTFFFICFIMAAIGQQILQMPPLELF